MKYGALYPSTELRGTATDARRFCTAVEAMGYDYISVGDHVLSASHADRDPPLWGPYDETEAFHDPFVLLAFMAAATTTIQFATGVLVLPQRQTVLVAKQAADVALLSDGRLRIAVGVGWSYLEYGALGQPFAGRGVRLESQISMLRALWGNDVVSVKLADEVVDRAGLGFRPTWPIQLWHGGGTDVALRRGARIADGFCFAGDVKHALVGSERIADLRAEAGLSMDGFGLELVLIPPAPGRGTERWPKRRPSFLGGVVEACDRWGHGGGTHATVVTTWMGNQSLDDHLDYLHEAIALLKR